MSATREASVLAAVVRHPVMVQRIRVGTAGGWVARFRRGRCSDPPHISTVTVP